ENTNWFGVSPRLFGSNPNPSKKVNISFPNWGVPDIPIAPLVLSSVSIRTTRTISPKPNVAIAKNTPVKRNDGMRILIRNIPDNYVAAIILTMTDTSKFVVNSAVVYARNAMRTALRNHDCTGARVIDVLNDKIILLSIKEVNCI